MRALKKNFDVDAFFERVATAPSRVLMLDYDGTLAPFRVDPAEAVPYPGVIDAMTEIMRDGATRVVIVSGRPASEIPPLLAPASAPEIWGGHGWERLLPDGRLVVHALEPSAHGALQEARDAARGMVGRGARIEEKRASIALHWRGLPAAAAEALRIEATEAWSQLSREANLEMLPFDGGLELRARGRGKAYAVNSILAETDAASAVAYLGDDITDEDAFRAVKPRGAAVLVRPELRDTEADLWLEPPAELLAFLDRWR